jgi:hypothetical protein
MWLSCLILTIFPCLKPFYRQDQDIFRTKNLIFLFPFVFMFPHNFFHKLLCFFLTNSFGVASKVLVTILDPPQPMASVLTLSAHLFI